MDTIIGIFGLVLVIVSIVVAVKVVNYGFQLYMRVLGADVMFFSASKKITAIFVVVAFQWLFIFPVIGMLLGINMR